MRTLILGAGRVGRAIAYDLARESGWQVAIADRSVEALERASRGLDVERLELAVDVGESLRAVVAGFDLVVGALPSFLGFAALREVIEAGKPYVDISFFEEDPLSLGELAREHGVVAVVDCGVAPGFDNLILGHELERCDHVDRFTCLVGGLPVVRSWPWEYKAPFAPYDVINEYTRPARMVVGGKVVTRPALSEPELVEFPGVGTLEAFNTDGLRTLLTTVDIPEMLEKTLRYPGHAEKMRLLREAGFFSSEPVALDQGEAVPLELTSKLLFDAWQLAPDEEELTVMRVVVEGEVEGSRERHTYDLMDRTDHETGLTSMARTTGFTCAAIARLVAAGDISEPGVYALEHVGRLDGCYERVAGDLRERGIHISEESETPS